MYLEVGDSLVITPMHRSHESAAGVLATGFDVLLGNKAIRHETPAFELRGTAIKVKLIIRRANNIITQPKQMLSSDYVMIQIVLVDPLDDIIQIEVNEMGTGFLTSDANSFTLIRRPERERLPGHDELRYLPVYIDIPGLFWKPEFMDLTKGQVMDITLKVGEEEIRTSKSLLITNSVVFKDIIDGDLTNDVIHVEEFSFTMVQEMVRFMIHGYCGLWGKYCDELARIADHYKVKGMSDLAAEKKKLLHEMRTGAKSHTDHYMGDDSESCDTSSSGSM